MISGVWPEEFGPVPEVGFRFIDISGKWWVIESVDPSTRVYTWSKEKE